VALARASGDQWVASLELPPGSHTYKFIVDGEWLHDPSRPSREDEKGNVNNVILVGEHGVIKPEEEPEHQGCSCRHDQEEEEEEESSEEESEEEEEEEEAKKEASTSKKPYCVGKKVADEAPVSNFVDVAVGAPGRGQWVKEALGASEEEAADIRERILEEQVEEWQVTAGRVARLHKEVRALQQKLGTAWYKEVAEVEAERRGEERQEGRRPGA